MLLSMTGFGECRQERDGIRCGVEVRTVNNRFLKTQVRLPDSHGSLEQPVERLIKDRVRRGSVQVFIRLEREASAPNYRIQTGVLRAYLQQMQELAPGSNAELIGHLLQLPGVVETADHCFDPQQDWPLVGATVEGALANLEEMRRTEGAAMEAELRKSCDGLRELVDAVQKRAPETVRGFHDRLCERVAGLLKDFGVTVQASDLVKEVAVFAERADIAEEIARLRSHLDQFDAFLREPESTGRKLEFLIQEMHRESNTIGSKANDTEISRLGVEMKSLVERVREVIQNVE